MLWMISSSSLKQIDILLSTLHLFYVVNSEIYFKQNSNQIIQIKVLLRKIRININNKNFAFD